MLKPLVKRSFWNRIFAQCKVSYHRFIITCKGKTYFFTGVNSLGGDISQAVKVSTTKTGID